jgi:hypothetical protein
VRSVTLGLIVLAGFVAVSGTVVGCGAAAPEPWETNPVTSDGDAGNGSSSGNPGHGSSSGSGTTSSSGGSSGGNASSSGGGGSSSGSSGGQDASVAETGGGPEAGTKETSAPETGSVTSADGFAASRQACIDKINALRATDTAVALQPYTLYNDDANNTCVDTQASTDQSHNSAHYAFINNAPACQWGQANGWAQDECEQGYGTGVAGITQCLQDMWDESLKPNCAGCVGCTVFGGACNNCDYSGSKGYECGHYVNMSAPYFTQVACGFAGTAPSSSDGWAVQNFE